MISLCANLHRLGERASTSGQKHELLEREFVASMRSTVDNIESRCWQDERRLDASEVRKVLIKGNSFLRCSSLGNGNRNAKDSVSTQFALVRCTVKLDQEVIDLFLLGDLEARADEFRSDDVVDIGNGLGDALK
jgi:hypothetical protein